MGKTLRNLVIALSLSLGIGASSACENSRRQSEGSQRSYENNYQDVGTEADAQTYSDSQAKRDIELLDSQPNIRDGNPAVSDVYDAEQKEVGYDAADVCEAVIRTVDTNEEDVKE